MRRINLVLRYQPGELPFAERRIHEISDCSDVTHEAGGSIILTLFDVRPLYSADTYLSVKHNDIYPALHIPFNTFVVPEAVKVKIEMAAINPEELKRFTTILDTPVSWTPFK